MFLLNDVIQYLDAPDHPIRILWIDEAAHIAHVFALRRPGALPQARSLHALRADLQARRARLLLHDPLHDPLRAPPYDPLRAPPASAPSPRQRALQLKAWEAVSALHADPAALYGARTRPALLARYAAGNGISVTSLMRYLRRYWERGQTIDALLPDYANSGGRGKQRAAGGVKRGRPRNGAAGGRNVDGPMRTLFQAAAARYAHEHGQLSRPDAYRQMVADHFSACAPDQIPSYGQFDYWLTRDGLPS